MVIVLRVVKLAGRSTNPTTNHGRFACHLRTRRLLSSAFAPWCTPMLMLLRHDTTRWAATWAVDGVWEIGRGEQKGRSAITTAFDGAMGLFESVVQLAGNGTATIGETQGRGRWYMTEYARTRTGKTLFYIGHYDDEYVLENGRWCFARRKLTWHYQGPPDLSGTFGLPSGYSR